jgi:general secretion pathway protein E/type IV pilus assembly protein PilB
MTNEREDNKVEFDSLDDFEKPLTEQGSAIDPNTLKKQVEEFRVKIEEGKDVLSKMNKDSVSLLTSDEKPEEIAMSLTLGERLVKDGIISRDQLEIALKEQRESPLKKEIGTILVELNFITDTILSKVLSETSGVRSLDLRSMQLDPELIKRIPKNIAVQYKILAIHLEGDELHVASSDVYNVLAIDQIKKYFHKNIKIVPFFANDFQISDVIDQYYDHEMDMHAIIKEIETGERTFTGKEEGYSNPTVRLVDSILTHAVKLGASDIHFEPENEFVRLRYRIDGRLMQILSFHKDYWSAIVVRIKILSNMNIAESRNPQDGRISYTIMGRKVDFRISTMPTIFGENVVARILDKSRSLVALNELGLSDYNHTLLKKLLKRPEGVIIVTGPTGSGKTTTLYAILSYINSMEVNIMTLEDPVEYQLPIIRQSQVREDIDLSFESGVKTMMRQDPDIIFVGEVRDHETAAMMIRASMTGHRVFTTLHTNDSIGTLPRLIDIGISGPLLSGNIVCTIAQRLARKLCSSCKVAYPASAHECKVLNLDPARPITLYKHTGCPKCYNTGYKGRIAVYEILPIDSELDELIYKEASRKEVIAYAKSIGFRSMADDAIEKIVAGITDLEEIIRTINMTERMKDVHIFL